GPLPGETDEPDGEEGEGGGADGPADRRAEVGDDEHGESEREDRQAAVDERQDDDADDGGDGQQGPGEPDRPGRGVHAPPPGQLASACSRAARSAWSTDRL